MFYVVSKVAWFFLQPLNLSLLLIAAALVALFLRRARAAAAAIVSAFLILSLSAWTSLGALMMQPLEERFARPALPARVDGIVVLGGGFEAAINKARGGYDLNRAGDRFVEAAVLARRFPEARVVVSGGEGSLLLDGDTDAATAPRLFAALGIAPERLVLEGRSRNTAENAAFAREMVAPGPGETWLLVTSAFHMPRAMGLFRKAGFPVLPWPTDYRTTGRQGFGLLRDNPGDALNDTTTAVREWIGLAAYYATGRIDTVFPR